MQVVPPGHLPLSLVCSCSAGVLGEACLQACKRSGTVLGPSKGLRHSSSAPLQHSGKAPRYSGKSRAWASDFCMISASTRASRPLSVSHSSSASAPALPLTARRLSLRSSLLSTFCDSVVTLHREITALHTSLQLADSRMFSGTGIASKQSHHRGRICSQELKAKSKPVAQ